jgi:soluble lytic murein transglycosylase
VADWSHHADFVTLVGMSPGPFTAFGLLIKSTIVVLSLVSMGLIYLPDWPVTGRWFFPYHYREIIEAEAQTRGLDPLFVAAIIRQESGFVTREVSRVGAVGLMQIMPRTAVWINQSMRGKTISDASMIEPRTNIRLGCWYLQYLFKRFGDTSKVLAAYNGGEGNMKYWSGLPGEQLAHAFPETRAYVAKCLYGYERYRALYGKPEQPARPWRQPGKRKHNKSASRPTGFDVRT